MAGMRLLSHISSYVGQMGGADSQYIFARKALTKQLFCLASVAAPAGVAIADHRGHQ